MEIDFVIAQTMIRRWALAVVAAAAGAALAGCESTGSLFQSDKIDYKSARQGPSLEVPPDLTQLSEQQPYVVPGGPVSAVAQQAKRQSEKTTASATALNAVGDVRMERDGNERWLVIQRSPEQIWPLLEEFWQDNGFVLALDEPKLGIMETDWAENRAKLPQDFIRATIGKLFDGVYSTGERDKFRTRVERAADGTEIYVSHRGMVEVYSDAQKTQTVWQPRPTDPELETEFLRRLMVRLGVPQERSRQIVQQVQNAATRAEVVQLDGAPALRLGAGMDDAWRRVGLSLDRTGFTVEDRDRAQRIYYVRYVDPVADAKANESGIFSRFFRRNSQPTPVRYRIKLSAAGATSTTVSVLDEKGAPARPADAQRIVGVLANDLR